MVHHGPDLRSPALGGAVLVVDDIEANARLLARLLERDGYTVATAHDGAEALEIVSRVRPDLVLMDVRMPRLDGFEACERLKSAEATRLIPVVLMTGAAERQDRVRAINVGADDFLTKPVDESELRARVRSLIRLKRYTDDLDSAESMILSLALTVEARDPYTEGHCERLADYGATLGERIGLGADDIATLRRGGYLHDLGKIATPDAILRKPGPLTDDEYRLMKEHAVVGERLCGSLRALARVRPIIRHHHERLDGSGYPDGLKGDQIPLLAQIIGIVDVYDAMTTSRPYKAALAPDAAVAQLREEAQKGWRDPKLVEAFIDALDGRARTPPPE